jgi:phosphoribosylformylglycinamidine synthase II
MSGQNSQSPPQNLQGMPLADLPDVLISSEADGIAGGLSAEEYALACQICERTPNQLELGIFSVMWSEHCSYKSSKKWLKKFPTEAPWVILGPGENAGAVDIGGGLAACFKMESHNHPSFIEPYQGAATGVGGILRDVFTMGARPVAILNALRFGSPDHPKTRHLVNGVVSGIGGYGNCVGVPTVGGECEFDPSYNGNPLVNAMAVGIAPADRIFTAKAEGAGNPVVYVGAKTGRDGIHGATMASTTFDDEAEQQRPTVQVGDPFTEKLLIEACMELMATEAIVAIQDMGAAGLTSSSFEMASKGGLGVEVDLDLVPMRETGMRPYEIMLSESQERMLMVLKPSEEGTAEAIFHKWGLDFAIVGRLTDTKRMVLNWYGSTVADIPIPPLADESPEYDRPWVETTPPPAFDAAALGTLDDWHAPLLTLIGNANGSSKRWIWEQYDHSVMGDSMVVGGIGPGGDSALVRIHGTKRAMALTSDCTPRYCEAHPFEGGKQAVAEAYRNLTAVGAKPLAITDNLNFGSPQRPEIMGQFVGCTQGMSAACLALEFPVVSGNVSLYNETNGQYILPTPVVGGLGLLEDAAAAVGLALPGEGLDLVLIGAGERHLGCSVYVRDVLGKTGQEAGPPPFVDLAAERRNGDCVRALIQAGAVAACHDLSDGGLLVALAEMAMAGGVGVDLQTDDLSPGALFGEDQGRYLLATNDPHGVLKAAAEAGVPAQQIGQSGGDALTLNDTRPISVETLISAHESWLPGFANGDA